MRFSNQYFILLCIIIGSLVLRLLPLKYGISLAEVDPYHQYWLAEKILNGEQVLNAHDQTSWYPRERILSDIPLGVSLIGVGFYNIISPFGLELKTVCVFTPLIFVASTLIVIHFLGKEISSRVTGLIAAGLVGISPIYTMRSAVGWFDNDVIGLMFLLASGFFFIKAIRADKLRVNLIYAAFTSICVFWVSITWIGYYVIGLLSTVYLLWIIFDRKTTTQSLAVFIISILPSMYSASFIWGGLSLFYSLPVTPFYFVLSLALITAFYGSSRRILLPSFAASFAVIIGLFMLFSEIPYDPRVSMLINPLAIGDIGIRPSVQENLVTQPETLLHYHGIILAYGIIGLAALVRHRRFDVAVLFMVVYFITAFYFAVVMVRFNFLVSAAISILGAYGMAFIVDSIKVNMSKVKTRSIIADAKIGYKSSIDKHLKTVIIIGMILGLTLLPTAYSSIMASDRPQLKDTSLLLTEPNSAWNDSLDWVRANCEGEVMIAWWDYGHWLKAEGKVVTVCDNTLIFPDQVAKVGLLYLSDEETAWDMMKNEFGDAEYVLVFTTFRLTEEGSKALLLGDDGKWREMYRLTSKFYQVPDIESYDKDGDGLPDIDSLLGKCIIHSMGSENVQFERFDVKYISQIEELKLHEDYARILILQRKAVEAEQK